VAKTHWHAVASIDVGSNALRMLIAQLTKHGKIEVLEDLSRPTNIGRDTFSLGRLQAETIVQVNEGLGGFAKLMKEYRVKKYRAVTTSGIREARNCDQVLELVRLRTGLEVEVINNAEERFLTYKAIRGHLPDYLRVRQEGVVIVDIGSGGVEISVYKQGHLQYSEYIKVGSLRLSELLSDLERTTPEFPSIMEEYIESKTYLLEPRLRETGISNFIGLGGEIKTLHFLCEEITGQNEGKFISRKTFDDLVGSIRRLTKEQLADRYNLVPERAAILLPSAIIFNRFLLMTEAAGIHTPMVSLRHGLIEDMVDNLFNTQRKHDFLLDIVSAARYIGKRYGYDAEHAAQVEKLAVAVFDQTRRLHKMGSRERFYLQIAAILHDIGKFVNLNQHHVHSSHLIRSLDIMGFSSRELNIIAVTALYHSEEMPEAPPDGFNEMSKRDRLTVSKLAAMLMLADALDISHKQKIQALDIGPEGKQLLFRVSAIDDIALEEWTFNAKSSFFAEMLGIKPILKRKGG